MTRAMSHEKDTHMEYNSGVGPRTVSYTLASNFYEYLMRLIDLGMIEGPIGDMKPNPEIAKVVELVHAVLAGGEVRAEIIRRGNPDIFNELNRRLVTAQAEANAINAAAGYYVTASP